MRQMGRLVLSFLVLAQILLAQATAARPDGGREVLVRTGDEVHAAVGVTIAGPPSSSSSSNGGVTESSSEDEAESSGAAQPPGIGRLGRHHAHHAPDKSVAGGGVIIGGLVTAVFAAVYCYIRVTGRRADEEKH
ncbi:hypothetical protein RHSIM_Rhsim06G0154900 [Rhododendron simsii]|uniref:Uncharacterized protein n=1 Tax=Rhododendron simsii TaxID=118357 RepID=A0A834LL92_RHOSS|nr:hypothetical protein RHSIM_Rhsim06G0154900 [Rhododendron simsii]